MQEREKIRQLFERYQAGQCTPAERARLHAWFNRYVSDDASGLDDLEEMYRAEHTDKKKQWVRLFPYAAAVATIIFATVWYVKDDPAVNRQSKTINLASDDIAPGGNRATLILSNGRQIDLSEMQTGIIVGSSIRYADGSAVIENGQSIMDNEQLGDDGTPEKPLSAINYQLSTPNGGTYQITLHDGTKVWLNAASTLHYPSRFDENERVVFLEGEAYFEVAKSESLKSKSTKKHNWPFRVISENQEIEVLGTAFNISAYADESEVKTTLVEGSVQLRVEVSGECISLMPGEQSVLSGNTITKQSVDTGPYTAWKDGNFYFDITPLSTMMKQMSRWYNVDVVYKNEVPRERFSGTMSRSVTLQTVLELLRVSEINYRIQGHQLIIE